jgi:hypothetical protein
MRSHFLNGEKIVALLNASDAKTGVYYALVSANWC